MRAGFPAIHFLYREVLGTALETVDALRVRRPATIRTALAVEEVWALLAAVENTGGYPTRLVVHLLYGCGLRVSEPLELRIKDVDLVGGWLVIRVAKGNKDRRVPLPEALRGFSRRTRRCCIRVLGSGCGGGCTR